MAPTLAPCGLGQGGEALRRPGQLQVAEVILERLVWPGAHTPPRRRRSARQVGRLDVVVGEWQLLERRRCAGRGNQAQGGTKAPEGGAPAGGVLHVGRAGRSEAVAAIGPPTPGDLELDSVDLDPGSHQMAEGLGGTE